ncbi:MAG: nuclear transport factor 2 family protein [Pseudomonadota bacterium]
MSLEDLKSVATRLVEYCNAGNEAEGLSTLYAPDAVSCEAFPMPGQNTSECVGVEAIRGKHAWWDSAMEVHSSSITGPFYHGADRFALIYEIDVTERAKQERSQMKEVGIYTVADGKIVREEFFYDM